MKITRYTVLFSIERLKGVLYYVIVFHRMFHHIYTLHVYIAGNFKAQYLHKIISKTVTVYRILGIIQQGNILSLPAQKGFHQEKIRQS